MRRCVPGGVLRAWLYRMSWRSGVVAEIPIACTLSPGDYRTRLAEVAALTRDALRRVERHDLRLELHYSADAAARVHRLVEQERACCTFLQFEVFESGDDVCLLITFPPSASNAVPELLAELTGDPYAPHDVP